MMMALTDNVGEDEVESLMAGPLSTVVFGRVGRLRMDDSDGPAAAVLAGYDVLMSAGRSC